MLKRFVPRSSRVRYLLVAVLAFTLGSATIVEAAPAIALIRLADATDATKIAAVDGTGNVQVKVNNLPTTQAVSGTVGVSNFPSTQNVAGTVNVGNLPTTQNVAGTVAASDANARQAFQVAAGGTIPDGSFIGGPSFLVPAGKRLVIEFVSGLCFLGAADQEVIFTNVFVSAGGSADHFFPVTGNATHEFITNAETRLYADGGTSVIFQCARTGNVGTMAVVFRASGYLIDYP